MNSPAVLVVESSPGAQRVAVSALVHRGYRVRVTDSVRTAREIVDRGEAELVVLDLDLPDAPSLAEDLRARARHEVLPVLALSSSTPRLDAARAADLGFAGVISKPCEPRALLQVVAGALPGRTAAPLRRRVMVADDDPVQRKLLQLQLGQIGFDVVTADNGAAALDMMRRNPPDALVGDVLMPDLDGYQLCFALRNDPRLKHLPIVLTSALPPDELGLRLAQNVGANAIVVRTPELREVVDALLLGLTDGVSAAAPVSEVAATDAHAFHIIRQLERQVGLLRRAEAAARASEERYRLVVEGSNDGVFDWDVPHNEVYFNQRFYDLLGLDREAFGRTIEALIDRVVPEDRTRVLGALMAHLERGEPYSVEFRMRRADGEQRHVVSRGMAERDDDGAPLRMAGVVYDVTEQRRAEAERRILGDATALLASSLDYPVTLANGARAPVPGLADLAVIDALEEDGVVRRVVHPPPLDAEPAAPGTTDLVHRATTRGAPKFLDTPAALAQLGLPLPDDVRSALVLPLVARGTALGTLTLIATGERSYRASDLPLLEELARRTAVAIESARLYQQAQHAVSVRDEFLSIASHELKTPLTALQLHIQSVFGASRSSTPPTAERLMEKIEAIDRQSRRLVKLVRELLDVSRIIHGRLELEREEVDFAAVVRDVASRLQPELVVSGSSLTVHADSVAVGHWDRLRLEQVATNLLANAIKYGRGKPIQMRVESSADEVRLVVSDEGIGIPAERVTRVFERFERAVSARNYGGLGLGLYIVRQIVEAHGGAISVESTAGVGSTFTVTLPVRAPANARASQVAQA